MLKIKLPFLVLVNFYFSNISLAQQSNLFCIKGKSTLSSSERFSIKDTALGAHSNAYPPAPRDFNRLVISTNIYFATSIIVFGVLYLSPEQISGWDKTELEWNTMFENWSVHVKDGPAKDNDNFFLNWIAHPYCGAIYYMTARSSGFRGYESLLYATFMSTFFWEYGVEAFAEVPSSQDLLITPIAGAVFGEVFFHFKKEIMKNDKRVLGSKLLGTMTLIFLDPFNTILDGAGYKQKVKTELTISHPVLHNGIDKPYPQLNLTVHF